MIKVHHLKESRSARIIWLLEELGVEYQLEVYDRNPETHLAPYTMRAIHPLGKAPIVEDNGLVLVESAAIIEYLLDRYAPDKLRPEQGSTAYYTYQQWLHFAEGSAMLPVLLKLFIEPIEDQTTPVFGYAQKESELDFSYINDTLSQSDYFVGNEFTAADIMMTTVLLFAQKQRMLDDYPHIHAYLQRITQRSAFLKAATSG